MIKRFQCNHLTPALINEIRTLEEACRGYDGLQGSISMSNEINYDQSIDSYYFIYDENQLVSFLFLFIPSTEAAEIYAYTLPSYRRKGYFSDLLQQVTKSINQLGIKKFLFVTEPCSTDGKLTIEKLGAAYHASEYNMHFDKKMPLINSIEGFTLSPSQPQDVREIALLAASANGESFEQSLSIEEKTFAADNLQSYSFFMGNERIGLCGVNDDEGEAYLFGVVIAPQHQGKGYGRMMLNLLLADLVKSYPGEIVLEVNNENTPAFHLYSSLGFKIRTQYDYYALPL